jgi:hypothetical protein
VVLYFPKALRTYNIVGGNGGTMPRDVEMTETGIGRVMLKDNIVYLWIDVKVIDMENLVSHFGKVFELASQDPPESMPVLLDLGGLQGATRDARELFRQLLKPEYNQKLAVVCHNPAQRVFVSFLTGSQDVSVPVRIVNDREEALRWLTGEVDEPLDVGMAPATPEAERAQEIAKEILKMASGDYSVEPPVSPAMDELDSLALAVSMLGEELTAIKERCLEAEVELNEARLKLGRQRRKREAGPGQAD